MEAQCTVKVSLATALAPRVPRDAAPRPSAVIEATARSSGATAEPTARGQAIEVYIAEEELDWLGSGGLGVEHRLFTLPLEVTVNGLCSAE